MFRIVTIEQQFVGLPPCTALSYLPPSSPSISEVSLQWYPSIWYTKLWSRQQIKIYSWQNFRQFKCLLSLRSIFFPIHLKKSRDTARTIPVMSSTVCLFTSWL